MNILLTTLMLSNMKNSENIQKKQKNANPGLKSHSLFSTELLNKFALKALEAGAEMLGTVDLGEEVVCHGREDVFCSRCPCHVGGGCIHAVGV